MTDAMAGAVLDAADVPRLGTDLLARAMDLTRRHGFSQGCFARRAGGDFVSWMRPEACRFCAVGFLLRASWELWGADDWAYDDRDLYPYPKSGPMVRAAFRAATRAVEDAVSRRAGHRSIVFYNDDPNRALDDIQRLFGEAAQALAPPAAAPSSPDPSRS